MSYLEMVSAPLGDISKGIISLWFRDPEAQAEPPAPILSVQGNKTVGWPVPVPPNSQKEITAMQPSSIAYWNAYGLPVSSVLGDLFLGPPAAMMPVPPPVSTDNMRMLLTFGDPNQTYTRANWQLKPLGVIPAVYYTTEFQTGAAPGIGWRPDLWPPPYAPYFLNLGDSKGKFRVVTWSIEGDSGAGSDLVPQSFIGIDDLGYLTICLQTNTKAQYKGYAFQLEKATELWASPTTVQFDNADPPHPLNYLAHPGYWNGYQFEYKDVSNQVMAVQAETFIIAGAPRAGFDTAPGPRATGRGWHHLLFSFDISGTVHSEQIAQQSRPPIFSVVSTCAAWLAVDDHDYSGAAIQRRIAIPNGSLAPKLAGTETTALVDFGPCSSAFHDQLGLGPNAIVPQNVFVYSPLGSPKDGLKRDASNSGMWDPPNHQDLYGMTAGVSYNALAWTAKTWPLYTTHLPGPFPAELTPPGPTVPDPKKIFTHPIYDGGPFTIPTNGHPIGIPTSTHHLNHNTGIEMAELQIWSGKTIDTGNVAMRRLFIDAEGKPVDMNEAEAVLGKPDIKLHGSDNWKTGKNTGTTGVHETEDDTITIPEGQFEHHAKIDQFKPEPQLNK